MNCEYDGIGFVTNIGKSKYWGVAQDPNGNCDWTIQLRNHVGKTSTFHFQGVNPKETEVAQIAANIKHLDNKVLPSNNAVVVTKSGVKYIVNFASKTIMYSGLDKIGTHTIPTALTTTPTKQSVKKMTKKPEFDGIGIVTNVGSSKYWGVGRNDTTACGWIVQTSHKSHSIGNPYATEQDAAQIANALYKFKGMNIKDVPNEYINVSCKSGNVYSVNPHVSKISKIMTNNIVAFEAPPKPCEYDTLPKDAINWSQNEIQILRKLTDQKLLNSNNSFWAMVQKIINM